MTLPRWKYTAHKIEPRWDDLVRPGLTGRIIHSEEELEMLGGEWHDTPAECAKAQVKKKGVK